MSVVAGPGSVTASNGGMVAGLIHDIPTCKQLIDRIMAEADAIIPTTDGLCLGFGPGFSGAGQ